ncbi:binding-protein-dependent transport systems inner membrane component [Acidimicrobium ferrooxidans DSM 10331]|uniref:Binding-protein-dependent transport systems inner membrane component n=1 Tax=Acidimicrobium ferrooxidans (strain DSM 10331 / JCM 15462 / NBRC 103882 / ICP) TaxID=525909 RepID=C7LZB7_ACIFD|nr:ABC transporter permease [Acidimicrobium ferrooxidans]ACU54075.1 binding-protein-dependent transport systems inner membrane component [Acidimicrobium ferrooxidans DSM 10331]
MTGYIIRRLVQSVIVAIGVLLIMFILQSLLPDPARAILGVKATPVQIAAFNRANDLNKPFYVQFAHYLVDVVWHHNLGTAYQLNESVGSIIARDAPKSLVLVGVALAIAVIIAVPIGVYQAVRRNTVGDQAVTAVSFLLYSLPTFFLGQLLILFLAEDFHLFPAEAPQGVTLGQILSDPIALVLPIANLVLVNYAGYSRFMRSSAIEALAQDFIRTARAKGLPERVVLFRHMLRNALIPVVTLIGLSIPAIFTAGLITEALFNFPGIGSDYVQALVSQDYPLALGITLLVAVLTVLGNLVADILYAVLDPRVRYR